MNFLVISFSLLVSQTNSEPSVEEILFFCGDSMQIRDEVSGEYSSGIVEVINVPVSCNATRDEQQLQCLRRLGFTYLNQDRCNELQADCFTNLNRVQPVCDLTYCWPRGCDEFSSEPTGSCRVDGMTVSQESYKPGINPGALPPWNCTMTCSAEIKARLRYACEKTIGCSNCKQR